MAIASCCVEWSHLGLVVLVDQVLVDTMFNEGRVLTAWTYEGGGAEA